jgi:6-phosphogluconate dehydrogenase
MGVSGSGKTSIGQLLAAKTGYAFYDADQFHPQSNIDKMKAGLPLTDEDRWPWLVNINNFATEKITSTSIIIGCSALKQVYRDLLSKEIEQHCKWIFLKGNYETILGRMEKRADHYMPTSLLQSQFDILEVPTNAIEADTKCYAGIWNYWFRRYGQKSQQKFSRQGFFFITLQQVCSGYRS